MNASRLAARSAVRTVRIRPRFRPVRTFATENAPQASGSGSGQALVGGIAGGALVFIGGYSWYHFSGAKATVNSLHQGKAYFDGAAQKLQDSAPEPSEALAWLRSTAQTYAAFIPGAKAYVDSAFNDLDAVHKKHGQKMDEIVQDTYNDLKQVTKSKGASLEAAQEAWTILQKRISEIGSLAGDAAEEIMNNHPELKEKVGGNIDQLKQMGEEYGPEAKEQVDKTWDQINDIVKGGISVDTVNQIKKVVQEKVELLKKMGDEAFKKGMDQAKPYLDKSPKVKELVEQNVDALKKGDLGTLWEKVKSAADSGNVEELEDFIKSSAEKAKSKGLGMGADFESYLKMIPGAGEIVSKLKQLQDIGQKYGSEAEDILKSTISEIKQVLQKKTQDAEALADKAKKSGKS